MLFQVGSNLMQEATYSAHIRLVPSPQFCLQQSEEMNSVLNIWMPVQIFQIREVGDLNRDAIAWTPEK